MNRQSTALLSYFGFIHTIQIPLKKTLAAFFNVKICMSSCLEWEVITWRCRVVFQPDGMTVSLRESVHLVSAGTTGLCGWPAARHLAEWALQHSDLLQRRSVILRGASSVNVTLMQFYSLIDPGETAYRRRWHVGHPFQSHWRNTLRTQV